MGLVLAYLRYDPRRPWRRYDRIVADEWLGRWMGSAAYSTVWQPMLQGKFGAHYGEVNLAWFWARIYKRTQRLAYYEGGFQALSTHWPKPRPSAGGAAHRRARRAYHTTARRRVSGDDERAWRRRLRRRVEHGQPWPDAEAGLTCRSRTWANYAKLRSMGAVALIVALKRSLLDKVYWANIPKR